MTDNFQYTPRFKDIRIKTSKKKPIADERVCEWPGCRSHGGSRCPKANNQLNDFYWFCQSHAGQYNKSWNFFEGMGEGEAQAFRESAAYGHRQTWGWKKTHGGGRKATDAEQNMGEEFSDIYGRNGRKGDGKEAPREQSMGRLQRKALETMNLGADATSSKIRKRYAELVRRFHPDANDGDRSSEEQLGRVIAAYQILKNEGMA